MTESERYESACQQSMNHSEPSIISMYDAYVGLDPLLLLQHVGTPQIKTMSLAGYKWIYMCIYIYIYKWI